MDHIAFPLPVVVVVMWANFESMLQTNVNYAILGLLRLRLVWLAGVLGAAPVNMARQRVKQLNCRVKIAVLEKPRTLLVQAVNRFVKIVSKVPTPTCQVCPVVKFAHVDLRRVSRVHQIVPRVCPGNSMRTNKNFV